jgi:hypothetical protein
MFVLRYTFQLVSDVLQLFCTTSSHDSPIRLKRAPPFNHAPILTAAMASKPSYQEEGTDLPHRQSELWDSYNQLPTPEGVGVTPWEFVQWLETYTTRMSRRQRRQEEARIEELYAETVGMWRAVDWGNGPAHMEPLPRRHRHIRRQEPQLPGTLASPDFVQGPLYTRQERESQAPLSPRSLQTTIATPTEEEMCYEQLVDGGSPPSIGRKRSWGNAITARKDKESDSSWTAIADDDGEDDDRENYKVDTAPWDESSISNPNPRSPLVKRPRHRRLAPFSLP